MINSDTIGPVEMLAVKFPGSEFKGEIMPELRELVEDGLIRVIDLIVVKKDDDGSVRSFEVSDLEGGARSAIEPFVRELDPDGLLGEEDLELAAEELEPGSTAALLVWEDRWAAGIARAIRNANGVVLAHERVPREVVETVLTLTNGDRDREGGR